MPRDYKLSNIQEIFFSLGLDTDLSEIASMMTAPDPGAALGAKAVVAAGKNFLFFL